MPDHLGYIAAAYTVVLGSALAYLIWMRRRVARARQELRDSEAHSGAE